MTIKEWYPEYNFIKRISVLGKYLFSSYKKSMTLDCFMYYKMDRLSKEACKKILLDDELREYEKAFNKDSHRKYFNNKKEFYKLFDDYIKRDYLFIDEISFEELRSFIEKYGKIVLKPQNSYGGQGIRILENAPLLKEFEVLKKNGYIAEQHLVNEESYRKIYDKSLNTIRVNTLIGKDGEPEVFAVINQFGSGGSITDNDEKYGIWAVADTETGVVYEAEKNDETALYYDVHPDTKMKIKGFRNESINEVKELALKLAKICPECRLIGWDIAVTDKGIELIEGNVTPELGIFQAISGIGLRDLFEREKM